MFMLCLVIADEGSGSVVSGRVVDERNFPVPFVKVIVNGEETDTDKFGKFRFLNVNYPYSAVVAKRSTSSAVIYRELSIETPELILFGEPDMRYSNSAVIDVSFPSIPKGSSGVLKFISTDVFFCEDAEIHSEETSKRLIVYWPISKKSIDGNIVFLQKNPESFDNQIEKTLSLNKRTRPFNVKVNPLQENNSPISDLTIYLSGKNLKSKGFSVYADFFSYNRNSEMLLSRTEGDILLTKSIVPLKFPVSFRLRVTGYAMFEDGSGFMNSTYTGPGKTVKLNPEQPPEIISPTDNLLGANGATEFSYSIGSGTGIFVIHFRSLYPEMNFYVVTGDKYAYLEYLSRDELRRAGSIEFKWNVKKHLTYFSVNDFVKPKQFANDIGYKAIAYSSERTFKTGFY